MDTARIRFEDPFGGVAFSIISISVGQCGGSANEMSVAQGTQLALLVAEAFKATLESDAYDNMQLQCLQDGVCYPDALNAEWCDETGCYIVTVDTGPVPTGAYELTIPLGTGETVILRIEVGESE